MATLDIKKYGYNDTKNYLTAKQESEQFDDQKFAKIANSMDSKMNFMFIIIEGLRSKNLKIPNKNNYSKFIEVISHQLFQLIGWLSGFVSSFYALL